jgi:predicted ester cyclase
MVAEGDKVVVRGRDRGTHSGAPFAGIEPRGNRFEVTWIDIFRVEDGTLREAWLEINVAAFRSQLLGE